MNGRNCTCPSPCPMHSVPRNREAEALQCQLEECRRQIDQINLLARTVCDPEGEGPQPEGGQPFYVAWRIGGIAKRLLSEMIPIVGEHQRCDVLGKTERGEQKHTGVCNGTLRATGRRACQVPAP